MHAFLLFLLTAFALPVGTLTYKDASAKFTVTYPSDWEKQEIANITTVAFLRPKQANDFFQENVNIVKQDMSAKPLTQLQLTDIVHKQTTTMQGFGKIVSEKPVMVAGQPATEMVYTIDMNPLKLKVQQAWFIKGKYAFVFTYTALDDKFDKYSPQAKAIIASCKFY